MKKQTKVYLLENSGLPRHNLVSLLSESFQVLEVCSLFCCFVLNSAFNEIVSHIPADPPFLPGFT